MCPINTEESASYVLSLAVLGALLVSSFCVFLAASLCIMDYIYPMRKVDDEPKFL